MKITDEQVKEIRDQISRLRKGRQKSSIECLGPEHTILDRDVLEELLNLREELKELRSKPLCVVPSEEEIRKQAIRYATIMGNDFIDDDEELIREQVEYDVNDGFISGAKWIKSQITHITPTQWSQIREALENYSKCGEWVSTSDADDALELMDSIRKETP